MKQVNECHNEKINSASTACVTSMNRFILHANANAKRIFRAECQNSHYDLANVEHIPIYANLAAKYLFRQIRFAFALA